MKIFDCFMYFDEDQILDLRLNMLNEKIDYFIIVESTFNHKGEKRKLLFDINKFQRFEKKIIYIIYDNESEKIQKFTGNEGLKENKNKHIFNAILRENAQRNYIIEGLYDADEEDIIFISDIDEIPKLDKFNFYNLKDQIAIFRQDMFHYKYNLVIPDYNWYGTRAVKKKNLISPQWLRNIKNKKYPPYRIDAFFSKKKYFNVQIINDGGWHFSNLKTPDKILHKYKSYLHYWEFEEANISKNDINDLINKKNAIYNLKTDKNNKKMGNGGKLNKYNIEKLPLYIQNNIIKFKDWID